MFRQRWEGFQNLGDNAEGGWGENDGAKIESSGHAVGRALCPDNVIVLANAAGTEAFIN
jgi:hypothetical protein